MLTLALPLVLACNGGSSGIAGTSTSTDDTGDTGPVEDLLCPTIEHAEIETAQPLGVAVDVTATVIDEMSGVFLVELYYKQEITTSWERLSMTLGGTDSYTAQIPAGSVGSGGMDYYIKAVDVVQNACTAPTAGDTDPFHFRVDGG